MKISEIKLGEQIKARWLLKTCNIRQTNTRPPRDFLQVTLSDGADDISGMLWNYINTGTAQPIGKAVNITAQVGEYNGNLQLTLTRLELADNQEMSEFLPDLGYSPKALFEYAHQLISAIGNPILSTLVRDMYMKNEAQLLIAPAAKAVHHAGLGGLLKHQIEVCEIGAAIARNYEGLPINMDLVLAGALIHDFGKLEVYEYNDCLIEMSDIGQLVEHIPVGIAMLERYKNKETQGHILLLQHIIASHHGKLEYGSSVTPKFAEAYIVHEADKLSSTFDQLRTANKKAKDDDKYTGKIFTLDNYPHLLQSVITETITQGVSKIGQM